MLVQFKFMPLVTCDCTCGRNGTVGIVRTRAVTALLNVNVLRYDFRQIHLVVWAAIRTYSRERGTMNFRINIILAFKFVLAGILTFNRSY